MQQFNTEKVKNNMFYYCESLTSIDLTKFNTEKVIYIGGMFFQFHSFNIIDLKLK